MGFEPSGTVAQCLGLQDMWDLLGPQGSSDTSGMTLWHTGTLLAHWHAGTHAGTVDRPMAYRLMMITQPLTLVDFRLQAVVVGFPVSGFMMTSVYLSQSSETAPTP